MQCCGEVNRWLGWNYLSVYRNPNADVTIWTTKAHQEVLINKLNLPSAAGPPPISGLTQALSFHWCIYCLQIEQQKEKSTENSTLTADGMQRWAWPPGPVSLFSLPLSVFLSNKAARWSRLYSLTGNKKIQWNNVFVDGKGFQSWHLSYLILRHHQIEL